MNVTQQRKHKKRQLEYHMAKPCFFNHWVKERKPRSLERSRITRRAWFFPVTIDGVEIELFDTDLNLLAKTHGGDTSETFQRLAWRLGGVDMTKSAKKKFLRKYAAIMVAQR